MDRASLWKLARTPRWIAALLLAFAIAAIFALLGQWQLSRAVESATVVERATETVVPLTSIAKPQGPVLEGAAGQMVTLSGKLVPGSFTTLTGRFNGGQSGTWVMGELRTADPAGSSLAVALGWAPNADAAASVIAGNPTLEAGATITGRYLATEPPNEDKFDQGVRTAASVAALVNQWPVPPTSVYGGYLVISQAPVGLSTIDSPKPVPDVSLNWLNIFYAIEWVVFAGLAFFLWYRLLKDARERELEEAAELAAVN